MNNEPNKPVEVEIRIDGRTAHRFIAERLTTYETPELLTLEAHRWGPAVIEQAHNPLIVDPPEALLSSRISITPDDIDVSADAADFLTGEQIVT